MSPRRTLAAPAAALLLAILASSCVRAAWNRQTIHLPVPDHAIDSLRPGDDLGICLERLGAPLLVRELGAAEFVLAYGWLNERNWGLNVSLPVADNFSASVDYDRIDRRVRGVVLFLDAEERLVLIRRGALSDLLADLPRVRSEVPVEAEDRTTEG